MEPVRWLMSAYVSAGVSVVACIAVSVRRATGRQPLIMLSRPPGLETILLAGLVGYLGIYFAGTWATHLSFFRPWWPATAPMLALSGFIMLSSLVFYFVAARGMGPSWRMGIDESGEPAPLVRRGLHGHVRHPIYASMLVGTLGEVVLFPCVFTVLCLPLVVAGLWWQAKREEGWLLRVHGAVYRVTEHSVIRELSRKVQGCKSGSAGNGEDAPEDLWVHDVMTVCLGDRYVSRLEKPR